MKRVDIISIFSNSMASNEEETYFSREELMFPHLDDGKIPTEQFLSACQGIADFVGRPCIFYIFRSLVHTKHNENVKKPLRRKNQFFFSLNFPRFLLYSKNEFTS